MSRSIGVCVALALGVGTSIASAGTFINFAANQNRVVHGGGYNGVGGEIQVSVCLDPGALPLTGNPEQAIRNVVAAFNQLTPTIGNIAPHPDGGSDFESVLLHEIGHCIGMDHNALGPSETGSNDALNYFANTFMGANGAFNVNAGADGVRGSRDDIRGDDINRNWFRKNTNNPFEIPPATVDRNTYSTLLSDLPGGHNFVENSTSFGPCNGGQPNTSGLRGFAPTHNTMFPVICSNNVIRRLAPDDVATLRIARAGRDGIQGSADDYTLRLNYIGQSATCNIKIRFTNTAGFAFCGTSASAAPNGDFAVTSATAEFQNTVNWFYNQVPSEPPPNIGPTVSANTPANNSTTALGGGNVGANVNGSITFSVAGGSGTGTTSLVCAVGSGSVVITSNATQTIAVGGNANPVGVRFTLTANPQTGVINCTATAQGGGVSNFSYTFTADAGTGAPPGELCVEVGQPIPDNNAQGLSSTLPVAQPGTITDLDVLLDINHTWVGDLIVDLVHASSATTVRLVNRVGVTGGGFGCSGSDIRVTLDDEATLGIQTDCQSQQGQPAFPAPRYRPANALSGFDGRSLNGNWTLRVSDNAEGDLGQLVRWCLLPTTAGNPNTIFADGFEP